MRPGRRHRRNQGNNRKLHRETTSASAAGGAGANARGIAFNTASKDVTLFDTATNQVTGSRPTGAVVRWLSTEQHYWDEERIWTYDYPEGEVQAIAVDPETFGVALGPPRWSLAELPDRAP
jgi:hypothetical protein